ncbi:hypothetical protein FB45DRAFT_402826 [Roridomyces roridus]|uniref:Uncharacterized protein n=1 Tax=Roridomyces roridus TaxID=1738132 RepID=A0AAD7C3S0_9AGAR|nr:hypothetical protein FB45DRAFT_402826 [Roridomyces roridus]
MSLMDSVDASSIYASLVEHEDVYQGARTPLQGFDSHPCAAHSLCPMATASAHNSPVIPQVSINYEYDDEPDEDWKANRKQMIEDSFKPMIQEAKDRLERKIQSLQSIRGMDFVPDEDFERTRLVDEFNSEKVAMKVLAKEEFEHALARERLQRRLRRDIPPPIIHHQSLRLDLEQEQAATLKEASLNGGVDVEAAFQSLIDPSSSSSPPPPSDDFGDLLDMPPETYEEDGDYEDLGKPASPTEDDVATIHPWAGALTIKITRLPTPPVNGGNVWVKASDAAREYESARRRASLKAAERPQITGPPPEPPKRWISASDMAKQTSQRRIEN